MRAADSLAPVRAPDRILLAVLAGVTLLTACRVEVRGGQGSSPAPDPVVLKADTLRASCPGRLPDLALPAPARLGVEARRLLPAGDGLLAVARKGGLHRHAAGRTLQLLEDGRDYALLGERLVRLEEDRIETFDYRPGKAPMPRSRLPARDHDVSIALLARGAYVHSAFNEDALVLRRSPLNGAIEAALLPVERDLLRTLLRGPEHLHEDEGLLVGEDGWLLHVPLIRDPVQAIQTETRQRRVMELAGGRRGEVRVEGRTRRDSRPCPGCTRRVEVSARVTVVPLYAGAAVEKDVLWILRLDPAGGTRAALLRVALDASEVRAWRLAFPATPGALGVWRDSLAIAAGPDLWRFPLPEPGSGAACEVAGKSA